MGKLFDQILAAVEADAYLVGIHAANRLNERRIVQWQVVAGLRNGVLIRERPRAKPNPCMEVQELLPDGTMIKAVWSWLPYYEKAKLVTVHFLDI